MIGEMIELGAESRTDGGGWGPVRRLVEAGAGDESQAPHPSTPPFKPAPFSAALVTCLPLLRRTARRLAASRAEAADLVQETALRALEKSDHFVAAAPGDMYRWLITILRHLHYDRCRRQRLERLTGEIAVPVEDMDTVMPAWRTVNEDLVDAAIDRLPRHLREPYLLFSVRKLPYAVIAARLGISQSTVGTRIFRAREHLRDLLSFPGGVPSLSSH